MNHRNLLTPIALALLATLPATAAITVTNGDFSSAIEGLGTGTTINQDQVGNWYGRSASISVVDGQLNMMSGNLGQARFATQIVEDNKVTQGSGYFLRFDVGAVLTGTANAGALVRYAIWGTDDTEYTTPMQTAVFNFTGGDPVDAGATLLTSGMLTLDAATALSTVTSATFDVGAGYNDYIVQFGLTTASGASVTDYTFGAFANNPANNIADFGSVRIDNVMVAVPEPSTYAALAGLLALGVVAWRRRRFR